MTFNCFGPKSVSGLGNAFAMHSECLSAIADVNLYGFDEEPANGVTNNYFHGSPMFAHRLKTRGHNIGFLICESTELNKHFHNQHFIFDKIWTASTYSQQILSSELNRPVSLVPHCSTRFKYSPVKNEKPIILLSFDGHSRFLRKNPVEGIEAIKAAFGDNCRIIVKAKNLKPSLENWLRQIMLEMDYRIINETISVEEMDLLYSGCDILLSLHTSEGFGLQMLEAMSFGCKVVATNYGGNTDFMTEENSYPVDYSIGPVTDEFFAGEWAIPNFEHAVEQLRKAYNDDFTKNEQAFQTALGFNIPNTIKHTIKSL